jgi:cytochrome b561
MSASLKYDRRTILLHWLTAALVISLWGLAQVIDLGPTPTARVYIRSAHILLGVAWVVIYVSRVIWRSTEGVSLPPADRGWMQMAAKAAHYGLYVLVAATLLLGLGYEAIRADDILTLGRLPSIAPGDRDLRRLIGGWHGTAANALLILAGLHAAAALFHQFVLKDNLLRRMMRA